MCTGNFHSDLLKFVDASQTRSANRYERTVLYRHRTEGRGYSTSWTVDNIQAEALSKSNHIYRVLVDCIPKYI